MFKKPFAKRRPSTKSTLELMEPRIAPATFTVTNLNDLGPGSLRDALAQSDMTMGRDTVNFQAGLTGTITLGSTLIIGDSVTILGPGPANLSISGNDAVQPISAIGFDLTIQDLTIEHGLGAQGGAIHSEGANLYVENVSLHDNKANSGGAIYVRNTTGAVFIERSTLSGNTANVKGGGAFLYHVDGAGLTIRDTTISGNTSASRGGGLFLYNIGATEFTIDRTTISGNSSGNRGGGAFLYKITSPTATIEDSTISGNQSANRGAGLFLYKVASPLQIERTTISSNMATGGSGMGGGVFVYKTSGALTFESTTISGNSSNSGGSGIHSFRDTTPFVLRNTTVSGNSGPMAAIELEVSPGVTIQNSTITANTSTGSFAGVHGATNAATAIIQSSIIAGNTGTTTDDLSGSFTIDHSLIQHAGDASIIDGGGNIFNQDPKLGPLANNGGPTLTHALLEGSPAIDTGSNPTSLQFDQRGEGFLRNIHLVPDMGAFEIQPPDLSITKTSPQSTYAPGDTITYTFDVRNVGSGDATGVQISDPVLAQTTFDPSENPGWVLLNGAYVYTIGPMAGNSVANPVTLTLHVTSTVPKSFTALTNTATVAGDATHGPELMTNNNTAMETDTIAANPVLHIAVDDNITKTVAHGGKIIYTFTYSNTGNRDADITLVDHLGLGSFFTASGSTAGWTFNSSLNQYELHIPTLLAGDGPHTATLAVETSTFIPTFVRSITNSVDILETQVTTFASAAPVDTTAQVETLIYQGIQVYTPGTAQPGHYGTAQVRIIDIALQNAELPSEVNFLAYPTNIRDSFRTALADFNGDGFDDVLIIPEHGRAGVKIFDGTTGALIDSPLNGLKPFGANKGAFVAIPKFNGQSPGLVEQGIPGGGSIAAVVFGSSLGGGAVRYFSPDGQGVPLTFFPFGRGYTGGVRVATGDVNGDGFDDLIAAQGNFGSTVKVYNGGSPTSVLGSFRVAGYAGGLNIAVGDVDHDGRAEVVAARNRLSGPVVEIYHFQGGADLVPTAGTFTKVASFLGNAPAFRQGIRVAVADVDLDGNLDIIAAAGFGGRSEVRVFSLFDKAPLTPGPLTPTLISTFTAFANLPRNAVWVSATNPVPFVPFDFGGGGS